jgi:hypothetical protein
MDLKLDKEYPLVCRQKKAILCWVGDFPVRDLLPECTEKLVGIIPNRNCSVLLSLYHGDKNIPFVHVCNFGTPKKRNLQKMIGQTFEIIITGQKSKEEKTNLQLDLLKGEENGKE